VFPSVGVIDYGFVYLEFVVGKMVKLFSGKSCIECFAEFWCSNFKKVCFLNTIQQKLLI
jgi:hypothetical protein